MAEHIFERLARERGITTEEMWVIISTRIEKGWNDPNPEKGRSGEKSPALETCQHRMSGCGMQ